MPGGVEVKGAAQLTEVGKALHQAGATTRQKLRTNLRWAVKPLTADMKNSLGEGLPHAGGLAAEMRKTSVGVRITEGRDVGVRIVAEKAHRDVGAIDAGEIHHPTFGRPPWVRQSIRARLISHPFERGKPLVQRAVLKSMDQTADKITR